MKTIGDQIREARKLLKLKQIQLTDAGISRVHISDVEHGKSKLVTGKAIKIYKKLLFYSLLKNIKVELSFDSIVDSDDYHLLKSYYDAFDFDDKLSLKKGVSLNDFENTYKFSKLGDLGIFYHHVLSTSNIEDKSFEKAYYHCNESLILQISILKNETLPFFEDTFKSFRKIASKLEKGHQVVRHYMTLIDYYQLHRMPIQKYTYFNIALFSKMDHDYNQALQYINLEIEHNPECSTEDYLDYQYTKASILMYLNRQDEALEIYNHLLLLKDIENHPKKWSIVCSNFIHFACKYRIEKEKKLVLLCKNQLEKLLETEPEMFYQRYKTFSNLGQACHFLDRDDDAKAYFKKAFDAYTNSHIPYAYNYLELIQEALISNYFSEETCIIKCLNKVSFEALSLKEENLYKAILIKFMFLKRSTSLLDTIGDKEIILGGIS